MPDIDVQSIELASPPAQPYQTQYTPGVLVRNNGVGEVVATGYLQCYDKASGVLLHKWNIQTGSLGPGSSAQAVADGVLDLSEMEPGTELLFSGWITCPGDMVPSNNPLSPVTRTVQEGEPPTPPAVTPHAGQHEDGGTDEIDVTNLTGRLAERQDPTEHASQHEDGGTDELNVDGLHGTLADGQPTGLHSTTHEDGGTDEIGVTGLRGLLDDPQTPLDHHATHENGGGDELSVTGLSGVLADDQPPASHGATKHDATVEATANKGAASGYCGLDGGALVAPADLGTSGGTIAHQYLRGDQTWQDVRQAVPGTNQLLTFVGGGGTTTLAQLLVPAGSILFPKPVVRIAVRGTVDIGAPNDVVFRVWIGPGGAPVLRLNWTLPTGVEANTVIWLDYDYFEHTSPLPMWAHHVKTHHIEAGVIVPNLAYSFQEGVTITDWTQTVEIKVEANLGAVSNGTAWGTSIEVLDKLY